MNIIQLNQTRRMHLTITTTTTTIIIIITLTLLLLLSDIAETNVIPSRRVPQSDPLAELTLGLYNESDKVKILTQKNFNTEVLKRNRSMLIEFYNSYCGHCRKFAPHYKNLAERLYSWRNIMPVAAIDCASDENNELCRHYEIMAYPTLRYFGVYFDPKPGNLGKQINITSFDTIEEILAQFISEEDRTRPNMSMWPNFDKMPNDINTVYTNLKQKNISYLAIIYDDNKESTMAKETILHLSRWPDIEIRRTDDSSIFHINDTLYRLLIIDPNRKLHPYRVVQNMTDAYVVTLKTFLNEHHVTERPLFENEIDHSTSSPILINEKALQQIHDTVKYVKMNKHLVYQADLERAIYTAIYNEIPKTLNISGDKFIALRRFLNALNLYNPLGSNGRKFLSNLNAYVQQQNRSNVMGAEFEHQVKHYDSLYGPIFSSHNYVGCLGSHMNKRGFTCSLWQLFHYLTVQAAQQQLKTSATLFNIGNNPLEILNAMHGYVKYFFGCTECSKHFQEMAKNSMMWNVTSKDDAILWLWDAHNQVNERLAGDATEDPEFPKIQFPSPKSCPNCYNNYTNATSTAAAPPHQMHYNNIHWNKVNVLKFLKNIHNPLYISRHGVDDITILPQRSIRNDGKDSGHGYEPEYVRENRTHRNDADGLEKLRTKRMISNVFNELDIRMGMLLYGFCIIMLVLAFKLFTFKGGYRKKPYYCQVTLAKV